MRNKLKISDKMKIAIVSGKDEGPTKLNAFDNALSDNCQNLKQGRW